MKIISNPTFYNVMMIFLKDELKQQLLQKVYCETYGDDNDDEEDDDDDDDDSYDDDDVSSGFSQPVAISW